MNFGGAVTLNGAAINGQSGSVTSTGTPVNVITLTGGLWLIGAQGNSGSYGFGLIIFVQTGTSFAAILLSGGTNGSLSNWSLSGATLRYTSAGVNTVNWTATQLS